MECKTSFLNCIKRAVWLLFTAIIGYLLIASIFSTCYIGPLQYVTDVTAMKMEINVEHTYYVRDIFPVHIVVFALLSLGLYLFGKKNTNEKEQWSRMSAFFCVLAGVIAVVIVLSGQYYPKFDQKHIIELAAELNRGDLSSLEEGGYLHKYPYQMGIILFYRLFSFLFGECNAVAFQVINALLIAVTYYLLTKIGHTLFEKYSENMAALVCLLFLPYLLFTTFLYGTVVGLTFALLAFYMVLLFQRTSKKRYICVGSVSMAVAILLKSNYVIFLIAAVLCLFLDIIGQREKEQTGSGGKLLFIIALIVCYCISSYGMDCYVRKVSGGVELKGVPMSAFVALGLQDGKSAPGWHNNYDGAVWERNHYDYDLADAEAKQEIKKIISKYLDDITAAVSFFVKKISSQWNNPTFQSLWILEGRSGRDGLRWLYEGTGRCLYTFFVNIFQTVVLAGTLLYAIFRMGKQSFEEMLLPVTFIGGFLFHLFWEAKSIYAVPFFLLLFPLCVQGYHEWQKWLLTKDNIIREKRFWIILAVTVLICILSFTDPFTKLFARDEDTGIFNIYTQEMVNQDVMLTEENS